MQLTDESIMVMGEYKGYKMEDVPAHRLLFYWEDYKFWQYADKDITTLKLKRDIDNKLIADYIKRNLSALMKEAKDFIVEHK